MNFYIDESGNSGDLSTTKADLSFGGQPVFSLAAIGVSDEEDLANKLDALRKKYKVKADELKLSRVIKRKPRFALEAVELLARENFPFFIEIVDKKYLLAVSITNSFIWPPYFNTEESQQTIWLKNIFADYVYHWIPDEIFFRFVRCMDNPTNEKTNEFFDLLKDCVSTHTHEVAQGMASQVEESKDDFRLMIEQEGEQAYKRFLPAPDTGKRDQKVWLLPHFSSFTNIYARINLYLSGNLTDRKIFHDEQAHFDEIIKFAKMQMEAADMERFSYKPPFADYNITEPATLFFKASPESPGIQLADIVAGSAMRWYWAHLQSEKDSELLDQAMDLLIQHSDRTKGIGLNMVVPHNMAQKLFGVNGY
ncbi:DUF3800 domain-containing protein [Burkholderia vietnamiensis]|uniref:DUF3800 domain-containing protein n=1 Tax=Burkholderia vietnamiensis TaxID=60552 RepID=UPI001B9A2DC7|nr:DUF3800 domain-containing protein [Burkholderia vietnamiensis]MBR8147379.1 DUF3800 domain-containing protein [Burkholderia vietnamiensis]